MQLSFRPIAIPQAGLAWPDHPERHRKPAGKVVLVLAAARQAAQQSTHD
jgi:hypothetical protein